MNALEDAVSARIWLAIKELEVAARDAATFYETDNYPFAKRLKRITRELHDINHRHAYEAHKRAPVSEVRQRFGARLANALEDSGITTLRELKALIDADRLCRLPRIGLKSENEARAVFGLPPLDKHRQPAAH